LKNEACCEILVLFFGRGLTYRKGARTAAAPTRLGPRARLGVSRAAHSEDAATCEDRAEAGAFARPSPVSDPLFLQKGRLPQRAGQRDRAGETSRERPAVAPTRSNICLLLRSCLGAARRAPHCSPRQEPRSSEFPRRPRRGDREPGSHCTLVDQLAPTQTNPNYQPPAVVACKTVLPHSPVLRQHLCSYSSLPSGPRPEVILVI
jgi:hypothetical protein